MEKDVSIKLTSDTEFLAERPMYFQYAGVWEGGHCVIGAMETSRRVVLRRRIHRPRIRRMAMPAKSWSEESTVEVTYLTQEAGALATKTVKVGAGSRVTIPVTPMLAPTTSSPPAYE